MPKVPNYTGTDPQGKKLTPKEWKDKNLAAGNKQVNTPHPTVYGTFYDPNKWYQKVNEKTMEVEDLPYINYNNPASSAPAVDPNHKPLNLGPNINYNPNTGKYFNSVTGVEISPIVEQYKNGGKVENQNLSKNDIAFQNWYSKNTLEGKKGVPYSDSLDYDYYSFYKSGAKGNVKDHFPDTYKRPNHPTFSNESVYSTPENTGGKWNGNTFIPAYEKDGLVKKFALGGSSTYQEDRKNVNALVDNSQAEDQYQGNTKKDYSALKSGASSALGSYGQNYYNTQENPAKSSGIMSSVAGAGGIGATVAGAAAIGDQVFAPMKESSEHMDDNGNLTNEKRARRNANFGLWFAPHKRLDYKGGLTDWNGDKYIKSIEADEKERIQQGLDKENQTNEAINNVRLDSAVMSRNAGVDNVDNYSQKPSEFGDPSIGVPGYKEKFKDGGKVKGPGTGTSDDVAFKAKNNTFIVPAKNEKVAEVIRTNVLGKAPKKATPDKTGSNIKVSNGEHVFTPEEVAQIAAAGIDLNALAPDAKTKLMDHMKCGGSVQEYVGGGAVYGANKVKTDANKKAPSAKKTVTKTDQLDPVQINRVPTINASERETTQMPKNPQQTEPLLWRTTLNPKGDPYIQENQTTQMATTPYNTQQNKGSNFDYGSVLNYALPAAQVALGAKFLKNTGQRPVNTLDPSYLQRISNAEDVANQANTNAQFGLSGAEKIQLNQERAGALSSGRASLRNLSGNSLAGALNMERALINDVSAQGLAASIADKKLKLQKQYYANDTQNRVDNLVRGKVDMANHIFDQKLDGWNTNQQSGASLVSAGLANAIGAGRYSDELKEAKKTEQLRNSWVNGI